MVTPVEEFPAGIQSLPQYLQLGSAPSQCHETAIPALPVFHTQLITPYQLSKPSDSPTNPVKCTCAVALLRSLAYCHSTQSAATWAPTEMLYHGQREEHMHVLLVFVQQLPPHRHPTQGGGVAPRRPRGQQAKQEDVKRMVLPPCHMSQILLPTARETATVWECSVVIHGDGRRRVSGGKQALDGRETAQACGMALPISRPFSRCSRSMVLKDMVGLETVQWGIVAGAYAHIDPIHALGVVDQAEKMEHKNNSGADDGQKNHQQDATRHLSETLLTTHTSVMKKLIVASQLEHARQVEKRLVERLAYRTGTEKPWMRLSGS
ncbi:hypothetical protein BU15DRAFT_69540 [Melanogaster broomeanus]|nr:hypothetical protein BU15DRAFT_69540 [Melanogaster broomeanus]